METILPENGSVDVLINNAGIKCHRSIEEIPMADLKGVMETNYFVLLSCTKALLTKMRENKNGCIIKIISTPEK